jgi:hypothetical protein
LAIHVQTNPYLGLLQVQLVSVRPERDHCWMSAPELRIFHQMKG